MANKSLLELYKIVELIPATVNAKATKNTTAHIPPAPLHTDAPGFGGFRYTFEGGVLNLYTVNP